MQNSYLIFLQLLYFGWLNQAALLVSSYEPKKYDGAYKQNGMSYKKNEPVKYIKEQKKILITQKPYNLYVTPNYPKTNKEYKEIYPQQYHNQHVKNDQKVYTSYNHYATPSYKPINKNYKTNYPTNKYYPTIKQGHKYYTQQKYVPPKGIHNNQPYLNQDHKSIYSKYHKTYTTSAYKSYQKGYNPVYYQQHYNKHLSKIYTQQPYLTPSYANMKEDPKNAYPQGFNYQYMKVKNKIYNQQPYLTPSYNKMKEDQKQVYPQAYKNQYGKKAQNEIYNKKIYNQPKEMYENESYINQYVNRKEEYPKEYKTASSDYKTYMSEKYENKFYKDETAIQYENKEYPKEYKKMGPYIKDEQNHYKTEATDYQNKYPTPYGQYYNMQSCTSSELRSLPGDCNKYQICSNSRWITMSCPKYLVFDEKLKICNFNHSVDGNCRVKKKDYNY